MSAAFLSAMVAGIAVIVSGIMQFLTLRQSRANTILTLDKSRENTILTLNETHKNTMATIVSAETQKWVDDLRADLAELATITAVVERAYETAMQDNEPWPGEHYETVLMADTLISRIEMRLDTSNEAHSKLLWSLRKLMNASEKELWLDRKNAVLKDAKAVFEDNWSTVFGVNSPASR